MPPQIQLATVRVNDKCKKVTINTCNNEFNKPQKLLVDWAEWATKTTTTTTATHTQKQQQQQRTMWKKKKKKPEEVFLPSYRVKFAPVCLRSTVCSMFLDSFSPPKRQPEFWVINKCVQSFQRKNIFAAAAVTVTAVHSHRETAAALQLNIFVCVCLVILPPLVRPLRRSLPSSADWVKCVFFSHFLFLALHTSAKQKPIDFIFSSDLLLIFLSFLAFYLCLINYCSECLLKRKLVENLLQLKQARFYFSFLRNENTAN